VNIDREKLGLSGNNLRVENVSIWRKVHNNFQNVTDSGRNSKKGL